MNLKVIDDVIDNINGGTLIQKFITDLNRGKKSFHKKELLPIVSIGISVFLNKGLMRTKHFGKKQTSVADSIKSIQKGEALLNAPETIYRSIFVTSAGENPGGAISSNGITISCSGFKSSMKNEYLAWLIMHSIERRLNEVGMKFNDTRYREIEDNAFVVAEKKRMAEFNFFNEKD